VKIEPTAALALKAVIENDLRLIEEMNPRLDGFAGPEVNERDLATVGYGLHNLYNALENSFDQISRTFENHIVDTARWHRELLAKMFLDIPTVRAAVLSGAGRSLLHEMLRFRHLFRHGYDFELDAAKLHALLTRWQRGREGVTNDLRIFAARLTPP